MDRMNPEDVATMFDRPPTGDGWAYTWTRIDRPFIEGILKGFEAKYGMTTEAFLQVRREGAMRTHDCNRWAGYALLLPEHVVWVQYQ